MLANLLLKHSLTIAVSRNKYWASYCSYSYPKWFSIIIHQMSPINSSNITNENQITYFCLGTIMHVATLIRIRPTAYHEYSISQLKLGKQPNIYHLQIFGCAVYVPIAPTQRTKMRSQRRLGIYVGFVDRRCFYSPLCRLSF